MGGVQNDTTAHTSKHSRHDDTQANTACVFFSARIVKQNDLIQKRGNGVENSNCERVCRKNIVQ